MSKRLIEIKRAEHSFNSLKAFNGKKDEMKSYIKKMPMLIKTNGLGQTFAFYFSKGRSDEHGKILDILANYFSYHNILKANNSEALLTEIIALDANKYRMITKETIAYLNWLRRFADGLLKSNDGD